MFAFFHTLILHNTPHGPLFFTIFASRSFENVKKLVMHCRYEFVSSFFDPKIKIVWNFHSLEFIPSLSSKKNNAPTQFSKCNIRVNALFVKLMFSMNSQHEIGRSHWLNFLKNAKMYFITPEYLILYTKTVPERPLGVICSKYQE